MEHMIDWECVNSMNLKFVKISMCWGVRKTFELGLGEMHFRKLTFKGKKERKGKETERERERERERMRERMRERERE